MIKLKDRKTKFKIVFFISFIPYIWILLRALYYSIFGYKKFTWVLSYYVGTDYGIEAFKNSIILDGFALCICGIIPICVIYQIVYIFFIMKKRGCEITPK
ncbi:MAG: hypothetical protein GX309_06715 [Clostridiales bacterium]|nr:hypothetical protein [Clostridiales bacterium]